MRIRAGFYALARLTLRDGVDERRSCSEQFDTCRYLTTYGSPKLPPSWLVVGPLTIGQLASAYRNLSRRAGRNGGRNGGRQKHRADRSGTQVWLQTCVRVRNVCGHHG
ncbi:Abi family protein [Rhodococcus erythropolis]|uniref:Abi family protein n=1 Tax=Rhodococcus erythropolis group TaxID=2840174 RepID=UPI00211E0E41|nr:Abi family protein [Rhodococcus erythropolis]